MKSNFLHKLWACFRRQQYEKIIKSVEPFVRKHNKPDAEFFKVLALAYDQSALLIKNKKQRAKRQEKARANFRAMLQYPSSLVGGYHGLGLVALHQGHLNKALRFYTKAYQIDSQNSSTFISLGNVYKAMGKYAEAMKWYKKYLTHPEISLTAFINIALMYDQRGKRTFARRYAKKALKMMGEKKQDKGFEALKERLKKLTLDC